MALLKPPLLRRRIGGGCIWLALVLGLATSGQTSVAADPAPAAYQVEAVFLFNFTQFIEWPAASFPAPATPFVIGVLGQNPFGGALEEAVRGEVANGRPFVIRYFRRVEDIDTCHILFISRSETNRLRSIFSQLQGRNILTVGDANQFGAAPHNDAGFLTLLPQPEEDGLEVLTQSKKWIPAPVRRGDILVNGGNCLVRFSNGRFLSTPHRVLAGRPRPRYSIPLFYNPNFDAVVQPVPSCVSADRPAMYEPTTYEQYIIDYLARVYAHRRKPG